MTISEATRTAKAQQATMERLTAAFARELAQVLKLLNREVQGLVTQMEIEVGRVVRTQANLGRALRARDEIRGRLERAGFGRLVEAATDEPLDRLAATILRSSAVAQEAAQVTPVMVDALAAMKTLRVDQLMGLGADTAATMWRVVLDGVLGVRPLSDLLIEIEDVAEVSARQARVLYDTAVSTYSRQVDQLTTTGKADEWFLYTGPNDKLTREFCAARVGKVFTRAEIDDMDNGIVGFEHVMLAAGGPNCRHRWLPVDALDESTQAARAQTEAQAA